MRELRDGIGRRRRDYRATFSSLEGRRVLQDLQRFCMHVAPTADPNEAVFAMGMQRVYRRIAAMMALDPLSATPQDDEENEDDR